MAMARCFLQARRPRALFSQVYSKSLSYPLLICTYILKFLIQKIKFNKLDFLFISNWIFSGYIGSKNPVRNRQKTGIAKFKYRSTRCNSYNSYVVKPSLTMGQYIAAIYSSYFYHWVAESSDIRPLLNRAVGRSDNPKGPGVVIWWE